MDKSEPKKSEAVAVMVSAWVSSYRMMASSGFSSDRCVRVHSARIDPNFSQDEENRPGAAPRGARWVYSGAE